MTTREYSTVGKNESLETVVIHIKISLSPFCPFLHLLCLQIWPFTTLIIKVNLKSNGIDLRTSLSISISVLVVIVTSLVVFFVSQVVVLGFLPFGTTRLHPCSPLFLFNLPYGLLSFDQSRMATS